MSITSLYLDAFITVVREKNFTKAAGTLHITQSALSQRVANLESELGVSLIIRDRGGARPTPEGETLLRYCLAREALEKEVIRAIKPSKSAGLSGSIRIGGFSSVMRSVIMPALKSLVANHPRVRLQVMSRELSELPSMLRTGIVDYIVVLDPIVLEGIATVQLGSERNVLVQSKSYNGPDVYLDHDENDPTTLAWCRLAKRSRRIERRFLDDVYGLLDGVRLGWGRAVIPEHLIGQFSDLQVISPEVVLEVPVHLQFFEQPYYPKIHAAVVDALVRGSRDILGDP